MKPSTPLVSVCVITYNHEKYISDAIDGILKQDVDFDYEIIIGEDCSTDSTRAIIEDYAKKHKDLVKVIYHDTNQGMIQNLLSVFQAGSGKYFAICEGDDYWVDPSKLKKQVSFLEKNLDYVMSFHDMQPFDETGVLDINFGGARRDLSATELQEATPIYTLTACFRNIIKNFPSEIFAAKYGDLFLWSLLGAYGKAKYMEDIAPAMYRVHSGGVFSKKVYTHKIEMKLLTEAALMSYYMRIGDGKLASHFKAQILKSSINATEYPRLIIIIIKDARSRIIRFMRRLFLS